jgi:hypothetical protein
MGREPRDIQGLLAAAGLTDEELADLIDGSPEPGRGAELLRRLGASPELAALVWAMRSDRDALEAVAPGEPDRSLVSRAVASGVMGEIPSSLAAEIEDGGVSGRPPRMPRSRVVRLRGSGRIGAGRMGSGWVAAGLAACLGLGFLGVLRSVWPAPTASRFAAGSAEPGVTAASEEATDFTAGRVSDPLGPVGPDEPSAGPGLIASESGPEGLAGVRASMGNGPAAIRTAGEALAAAREGRLVVRVIGSSESSARALVETITTEPSVSRVAVLAGESDAGVLAVLSSSLPEEPGAVFASSETAEPGAAGLVRPRVVSAYTIEVEPTERGFSLLLSGLRRDPAVLVELVRTAEPVTTPGSVSDAGWFRRSPRHWQARIAAPVLIETLGQ